MWQAQFSKLENPTVFEAEKTNPYVVLGYLKILTSSFSQSHNTLVNIQIHLGGKGRTTRLKETRMSPAEILLISQTRSPSRSPPKAKTNGKSGQEAAQKRTPWDGGKKKEEDFF